MAINAGSVPVTVGTTGAILLLRVPPGICNVTFWNTSATGTLYVGLGTAVTTANGLQSHTIPTPFFTYMGSQGATLYGTAATATCTFNYIMSTTS
jgi:hypothetical protein